jgi:hypothetical protein
MRMPRFVVVVAFAAGCKGGNKTPAPAAGSGEPGSGSGSVAVAPSPADAAAASATFSQTISAGGVGPLTATTDPKTIGSLFPGLEAKTEHEEGEDHSFDTTTLSQGGTAVLDAVVDNFVSDKQIFRVDVLGSRFATAKGIRIGSTVAELVAAYPDATCKRETYEANLEGFDKALMCEAPGLANVAFFLDPQALTGPDGKVLTAKLASFKFQRIIWLSPNHAAGGGDTANAAPAGKPYCFPRDTPTYLDRISATDDAVMFCAKSDKATACVTASLATGAVTGAANPPPVPEAVAPATTSADGTRRVDNGKNAIHILDAKTGKTVKSIRIGDPEFKCTEGSQYLGSTLYATSSLCDKPRSVGWLFDKSGELIGDKLDGVNLQGAKPFHLGGDRWAFRSSDSEDVLVVDVTTGKQRVISVLTPAQVGGCCDVNLAPKIAPLALTPSGKLVEVGASVAVIDPGKPKAEHAWLLPACK